MADKYSASANLISAKDYKNQEHTVSEFTVTQALSTPFEITAVLVSSSFSVKDQLGQLLTINRYSNESGSNKLQRSFNGVIARIEQMGLDANLQFMQYRITLRPWFWLLTHTHSFRVYQTQTTKDIISDIFDNAGFKGKYKLSSLPSTKREYCLQYNESDFDFVTRLLGEEGLHYYFTHQSGDHTMVIQDAQSPFDKADVAKFDMQETPSGSLPLIKTWSPVMSFHGASVELTAYDYSQSKLVTSKAKTSSNTIANNTKLASVHYPDLGISGDMTDLSSNLAKRRIEQIEQDYQSVIAQAEHDMFEVATWFSLSSHLDKSQLGDFSVVSTSTHYSDDVRCATEIKLIPKATPTYPTPRSKQVVNGLQSATVAGSTAGEINQDDQGRVRIQFHWDTEASGDKTSCYVRVAQMMAGSGYGTQFIPRVGQEVLVSFIDGDPDQPIITGSVYNSKNAPPYKEANTTKTGIKTKLTGQTNELYFDDKKDNELVYLHAAKDITQEVENNHTETVKGELSQSVTKAMTIATEDNYTLNVTKAMSGSAKSITLEADDSIDLKVGSSKISISSSSISIEATNIDVKASSALNLEGTNVTSKATSANKVSGTTTALEATSSNSIKGLSIEIKASTTLSAEGSLSAEFKSGLKGTFDGGVLGELKGAIVKVN
ncbi:type VI secretion system Vgr family protein [Vibrio neptunius]|uniref:Type VI secretion system tip protein VgrG n=1 Tax=Vibrio neptunius TaxID=170651 RepID=A0ABS3A0D4_9VIBR|nr:type VI secretion system tip protein TssI/VgrG [Vibrio neptunius]MBN3493155.1 type VI secretion system tip protein VgrG [Vibrio neptunius]MBN3515662.1 type VI secretion system tip protein VgrG [Vibrio neptunius]MBN3549835.1 type VI secretion system tip protein VgrG [Vibrio neptunius]MBN3577967.1 type VI secretion system tip protein VgrG [Vibrio neptunius]MCH9871631.1 type VI secretion system tip protein VgrG [Vibrio neptunius]